MGGFAKNMRKGIDTFSRRGPSERTLARIFLDMVDNSVVTTEHSLHEVIVTVGRVFLEGTALLEDYKRTRDNLEMAQYRNNGTQEAHELCREALAATLGQL